MRTNAKRTGSRSRTPGDTSRPRRTKPGPDASSKPLKASPRVTFTSTDRVLFPEPGFTKGDVLDFYQRISPYLLPHLKDRPITLERLPQGLASPKAPHFWQKNTPGHYPSWIPRVELKTETGKPVHYALVNDLDTLLYLVNQGTITFHTYFSTIDRLDCPDYLLFDLDVSKSTFANAVAIAKQIHKQLDADGVPSFPKTSGKTGIHILTPWKQCATKGGYDDARAYAMAVATRACEALPDLATTERLKADRGRRVYVDVIQNALGHHVVPPYVLRATLDATVSAPLDWKQVTPRLNPKRFTLKTIFDHLKSKPDPLRALL